MIFSSRPLDFQKIMDYNIVKVSYFLKFSFKKVDIIVLSVKCLAVKNIESVCDKLMINGISAS